MMGGLVFHLLLIFPLFKHQTGAGERAVQHDVDFIEGKPVFHQAIKSFKAGAGVAGEELHHFSIAPGAVLGDQVHRHVEMAQRHQRLDAVLFALLEQRAIKGDPFRVRFQLIALRKQTAPGDRGAEDAKAHLCHQSDIFFITMIKIDRLVARVELIVAQREAFLLPQLDRQAVRAVGNHIDGGQPFAALQICPFGLVGGQCAAP